MNDRRRNGEEHQGEERRQADRRSARRVPLEVWVEEISEDAVYFQRTADVSPGGLHLAGTVPHPPGTEVKVRFGLPDGGDEIEASGVVTDGPREEGGTGMGIRFTELDPEVAQRLEWLAKKGG